MEASQMTQLPPEDRTPGVVLRGIDGGRALDSLDDERRVAGLARLELMLNAVMGRLTDVDGAAGKGASG
jgi:hypothetical protein